VSDLDAIRAAPPPTPPPTRVAKSTVTAEASNGLSLNGPLDSHAPEEELQVSGEDEAALMAELTAFRRRQSSGLILSSLPLLLVLL
jgi:hypothetical protein